MSLSRRGTGSHIISGRRVDQLGSNSRVGSVNAGSLLILMILGIGKKTYNKRMGILVCNTEEALFPIGSYLKAAFRV